MASRSVARCADMERCGFVFVCVLVFVFVFVFEFVFVFVFQERLWGWA